MEVSASDAREAGLSEGDPVEVSSPRGTIRARTRVSGIRDGVLFVPFHYGYWDAEVSEGDGARDRAANEMTVSDWDPVSKQPLFKTAVARLRPLGEGDGRPAPAPTTTASAPVDHRVAATRGTPDTFEETTGGGAQ